MFFIKKSLLDDLEAGYNVWLYGYSGDRAKLETPVVPCLGDRGDDRAIGSDYCLVLKPTLEQIAILRTRESVKMSGPYSCSVPQVGGNGHIFTEEIWWPGDEK